MAVAPAKLIVYPTVGSIRSHEKYEQFFLIKSNNLTDLNENQQNWLEKPGKKMEVKNLNFVFGFFFFEKKKKYVSELLAQIFCSRGRPVELLLDVL